MTWDEFVSNVRAWSTERGIYEHSTAVAQALKACSEAGELCDAVIKGDRAAMIDAVGDVAVCLVNVANMTGSSLSVSGACDDDSSMQLAAACVTGYCAKSAESLSYKGIGYADGAIQEAAWSLDDFCNAADLDFMECCAAAWNQIKDRKGRMVAGGAFVKD